MEAVDRNGLEILSRDECFELLRRTSVGRIGVTLRALPVVLPVNIALVEQAGAEPVIVIRSVEGAKLDAAMRDSVVALEADHVDPVGHSGWSVLVQGVSSVVPDDERDDVLANARLRPWASESATNVIVVSTDVVSGRRLVPWHGH